MILDLILSNITDILGWVFNKLPNVNVDMVQFIEKLTYLVDLSKSLNYILPLQEALTFASILLSIRIALLMFWASMRVINLLRGSG